MYQKLTKNYKFFKNKNITYNESLKQRARHNQPSKETFEPSPKEWSLCNEMLRSSVSKNNAQ